MKFYDHGLRIFLFLSIFIYIECKEKNTEDTNPNLNTIEPSKEYKFNLASSLFIREKPSVTAPKVGKINECELVQVLEKLEEKITIDGIENTFYKVKSLNGIEGYAFGGYLKDTYLTPESESYSSKTTLNTKPFDIKGSWAAYPEEEKEQNYYYIFDENEAKLDYYFPPEESTDWTPSMDFHETAVGPYQYDGCCIITVPLHSGEILTFKVINKNGDKTLRINCFDFDPNLRKSI